ncbi:glycosyltransferase family 4 protein [Thermofilum pendens]|uniref:glycosyltransferase family 4 protein n=1 Tax=Thermofilum pendens TaxID=2269 RepID=UPI00164F2CE0|nr:glycosyltransferase family 4 protein [Thermofilum pendens]
MLHENIDYLYAGYLLGKASGAPAMVLLQNPPLFGSKKRLSEILKAVYLWEKLTSASTLEEAYATVRLARLQVRRPIEEARIRMLLNKYSLVVGVSRATVLEMGEPWFSKAFYLDPGVNLNEEEVHLLSRIRKSVKEKENCILYKGGLTPVKGILDVLLAYRLIRKERGDLKLVITGKLDSKTHRKLLVALKKLNLKDYVVLTGFISREQLFELNAKARLLLHPSHMDSFPYTVLESLHAGTPVVGYDIPALKIYYGGLPGVRLVREGDVEALATEAIDMLERSPKEVNPPSLKSWNEIIEEELSLVKKKLLGEHRHS